MPDNLRARSTIGTSSQTRKTNYSQNYYPGDNQLGDYRARVFADSGTLVHSCQKRWSPWQKSLPNVISYRWETRRHSGKRSSGTRLRARLLNYIEGLIPRSDLVTGSHATSRTALPRPSGRSSDFIDGILAKGARSRSLPLCYTVD